MGYDTYWVSVDWYNEYTDKDCHDDMIMIAEDLGDAAKKINHIFTYINKVSFEQLNADNEGVVYIPKPLMMYKDAFKNANDY